MGKPFVRFHDITFRYESASEPLFRGVSLHADSGWSGVVGANGTGKTTLLKLATGLLDPDAGHIDSSRPAVYCPQRTDDVPDELSGLVLANTKSAWIVKDLLGIREDWVRRWSTLSHGERKRAQIAVALWLEPDVLAIDEPTNHLDCEARDVIANALSSFRGVGLLVSHDRELLDFLCRRCFFIEPPEVITRPGGVTHGMQVARAQQRSLTRQYAREKRAHKKLQREAARRRELARQSDKKRSKRGIPAQDHDARAKKDLARVSGKDAVGGKLQRQLDGRLAQARARVEDVRVRKQYSLGIWIAGSVSKRDFLLNTPAGSLVLGGHKRLRYPRLLVEPGDRIALTGPNGSGKSTLIRFLVGALNVPRQHVTYVPQEIDARQSQDTLARARTLPDAQLGHLMTIVSCLGSRPHRLLSSTEPSPGEVRKLLLAIGITHSPAVIVMDEPTNHMDLPSIECLEEALSDCPCGLVLVSHDRRFLGKLTEKTWKIRKDPDGDETYVMNIL